jgi:hypothetical protein
MEELVRANSYLQGTFSDVTPEDQQVLSLALINRGVGPAREQSLHVKVGDRNVKLVSDSVSTVLLLLGFLGVLAGTWQMAGARARQAMPSRRIARFLILNSSHTATSGGHRREGRSAR